MLLMSSPIPHVTGCMSAKRLMCVFVSRKGRKIGFALDVQMKKVNVGIVGHEESFCREKHWTELFKKKSIHIRILYIWINSIHEMLTKFLCGLVFLSLGNKGPFVGLTAEERSPH